MFFGSRQYMKSVTAAEAAALAAWRVLAVGDRVGALVFDDQHIEKIRPHRSHSTVMQILRTITDMNHALRADSDCRSNPAMLNPVLEGALLSLSLGRAQTRERIHAFSRGRIADILDWQRRIGVPVLPLDTAEEAAPQVQRLLGQALNRQRQRPR